MAMEFKKDYGSFMERVNLFCKPTHWEIENGVTIIGKEIIPLADDINIVIIEKSDNTKTMVIFYNGSKNSNPCWFGWIASKNQMNVFPKIKEIYDEIDKNNKLNKCFCGA